MVVDREVALINSNNVNIRSNVEMMCRVEGVGEIDITSNDIGYC